MDKELRFRLRTLYTKCDQYLEDESLGKGLWPVDFELGEYMYRRLIRHGCLRGVEIGAGVGYSSLWLGLALQQNDGSLLSFEYFPPKVELLKRHMYKFGLNDVITVVPDDFRNYEFSTIFDCVFFDNRKCDYLEALELLLPYLKTGCLLFADNAMSHSGEMKDYLAFVRGDSRFSSQLIQMGSGLEVTVWL